MVASEHPRARILAREMIRDLGTLEIGSIAGGGYDPPPPPTTPFCNPSRVGPNGDDQTIYQSDP